MNRNAIVKFFRPNRKKVIVFCSFLFVALAGHVQTWVFSGKDMGLPKPPFYDLLRPFPFWSIWVMLLFPLIMLSNIIVAVGGYGADFIMRGSIWSFWTTQLIYFYILSCTFAYLFERTSILRIAKTKPTTQTHIG